MSWPRSDKDVVLCFVANHAVNRQPGASLVIVSTNAGSIHQLVARPSIESIQDVRSKIICSSRITATDFALGRIFDNMGMIPGKDTFP
jgi:hypothetical protein